MYQPKFGRHYAKGQTAGGPWSQNERKPYINVLEIKEAKLAIMAFTIAKKKGISIHVIIERGGGGGGGGAQKFRNWSPSAKKFGKHLAQQDHNYCRVPTRGFPDSSGYPRYRLICI